VLEDLFITEKWFFFLPHGVFVLFIDVKTLFLRFFILVTFYTFFNVFLFSKRFLFKNVGKVHSGKEINKKHFQNNSNETEL